MIGSKLMVKPRARVKERVGMEKGLFPSEEERVGMEKGLFPSEEAIMAAALAATLVEYRRCVRQRDGRGRPQGAGDNWRMLARWEQLARPPHHGAQGRA